MSEAEAPDSLYVDPISTVTVAFPFRVIVGPIVSTTVARPPAIDVFPASSVTSNNTWLVTPMLVQLKLELFIARVKLESQLSLDPLLICDAVIVASPFASSSTVIF